MFNKGALHFRSTTTASSTTSSHSCKHSANLEIDLRPFRESMSRKSLARPPGALNLPTPTGLYIQRDYSHGMETQFVDSFPSELNGKISEEEFRHTLTTLNRLFYEAENYTWLTCVESLLYCCSFYTLYLCCTPTYTKIVQRVDRFLDEQNQNIYLARGLRWKNPVYNGLLHIRIDYADEPDEISLIV